MHCTMKKPVVDRFWARVDKTSSPSGCWVWTGCHNMKGYGVFSSFGNFSSGVMCHRISWTLVKGEIENGLCVLHRCDNPSCVNPDHLFLGTKLDNNKDAVDKLRHQFGQYHYNSKFSHELVLKLREYHKTTGVGYRQLARRFNVSTSTMRDLLSGKTYRLATEEKRS